MIDLLIYVIGKIMGALYDMAVWFFSHFAEC